MEANAKSAATLMQTFMSSTTNAKRPYHDVIIFAAENGWKDVGITLMSTAVGLHDNAKLGHSVAFSAAWVREQSRRLRNTEQRKQFLAMVNVVGTYEFPTFYVA